MDLQVPIELGDPFHLHFECVYALVTLVLGLFYINHLDLHIIFHLLVTLLFLMDWIQVHFFELGW